MKQIRQWSLFIAAAGLFYATPAYATDMGGIVWIFVFGFYIILWLLFALIWLVVTLKMSKQPVTIQKANILLSVPFGFFLITMIPLLVIMSERERELLVFLIPIALVALPIACFAPLRILWRARKQTAGSDA